MSRPRKKRPGLHRAREFKSILCNRYCRRTEDSPLYPSRENRPGKNFCNGSGGTVLYSLMKRKKVHFLKTLSWGWAVVLPLTTTALKGQPSLQIGSIDPHNIQISWPSTAVGFVLEGATSVGTGVSRPIRRSRSDFRIQRFIPVSFGSIAPAERRKGRAIERVLIIIVGTVELYHARAEDPLIGGGGA